MHRSYSIFGDVKRQRIQAMQTKSVSIILALLFLLSPAHNVFAQTSEDGETTPTQESAQIGSDSEQTQKSQEVEVSDSDAQNMNEGALQTEGPGAESMLSIGITAQAGEGSNNIRAPSLPNIDDVTGAMHYRYDIDVPPGRNEMTPVIALINNSQSKENGIFGVGWSVDIPYIQRINKTGIENLYSSNYFASSMDGELVATTSPRYLPKIENGNFFKYEFVANAWTVTDKKGIVYKFGHATSTQQNNASSTTQVYKWMLEEVRDTNGNFITYEYYKEDGQIYPLLITYTGHDATEGNFQIHFEREARSDDIISFSPGFLVSTNNRIDEIRIEIDDTWVRKYEFSYTTSDNGTMSILSTIVESGRDEQLNTTTLPAVELGYQTAQKGWTSNEDWTPPVPFLDGGADTGARMADFNGDGLIDIVCSSDVTSSWCEEQEFWISNGAGWTEDATWSLPEQADDPEEIEYMVDSTGKDRGIRFVDVNGDGMVDITRAASERYTYINTGTTTATSTWIQDQTWQLPVSYIYSDNDVGLRMADINGDGLIDIVCANGDSNVSCSENNEEVWLNNGAGWTQATSGWNIPEPFVDEEYIDTGARLADVNGDGLADFLYGNGATKFVYINNGTDWVSTEWDIGIPFVYDETDSGLRLADVNGDNLLDLICYTEEENHQCDTPTVRYNTGSGWTGSDVSGWGVPIYLTGENGIDEGVRVLDVNNDGLADVFSSKQGGAKVLYQNNTPVRTDYLNYVQTEKGSETNITYKPTSQFFDGSENILNPELPVIIDVVSHIAHYDGLSATTTESFIYEGGDYYFNDYLNRRLSGFSKITATDAAGNVRETFFQQGNETATSTGEYEDDSSKIGKIYRIDEYDSDENLYRSTIKKWENIDLGSDADFVKETRSLILTYDGDGDHKDKAETYTFDDSNGNLTQKIEWGEVNGSADGTFSDTGSDKKTTTITYAASTTKHIVGLPSQETVTNQSEAKIKETRHYYDQLALGDVAKGNETEQERWISGNNYVDDGYTFDMYGLITEHVDPRNNATTFAYDTYNLYPATTTNPEGHVVHKTFDYTSGKSKTVTDPNGLQFEIVYDGIDRPIAEKQPDVNTPSSLVEKRTYNYTDTIGERRVLETNYLASSTSATKYTYLDGFDRVVQSRKETEGMNTYSVRDHIYNDRGLLEKESLPYFASSTAKSLATNDSDLYTTTDYDPIKRISAIGTAVGTTTYAYDDWVTTVTDATGSVKDYHHDAYENLVRVDEHNAAEEYTTQYEYDGNRNLTKITDDDANVRNFTYDGLNRRLTAEDLHDSADETFGTWTYEYDATGNLATTTDPKSQTALYTYDDINRVLSENYTGLGGTEVTYEYDSCTYGIGRMCSATTTDVITDYTYNALGLVSDETRTIDETSYTTSYSYDRQGNVEVIIYPDNSQVRYTYNNAGALVRLEHKESAGSFEDILSDLNYGPHERITYKLFGNNASTTNSYDIDELYRLRSSITSATGTNVQYFTYTYDAVGNITKIQNDADTDQYETYYTYDDLHRLVTATMNNTLDSSALTLTIESAHIDSDLTDFPIYVDLSDLPAGFWDVTNCTDIRTYKSGSLTELPREIVSCTDNGSSGSGELWMKYSGTLSSSADTDIVITFDGESADYAESAAYGAQNVWNGYEAVYHAGENSGDLLDSTAAQDDLTDNNTVATTTGYIGGGRDFTPANSEFFNSTDDTIDTTGDFESTYWLNLDNSSYAVLSSRYNDASGVEGLTYLNRYDNGLNRFWLRTRENSNENDAYVSYTMPLDTWTKVVVQFDISAGEVQYFVNGSSVGSDSGLNTSLSNQDGYFAIGAYNTDSSGSGEWDGLMDEMRFSTTLHSAAWIDAEYTNQSNPSSFYSVGSVATSSGSGADYIGEFVYTPIGNIASSTDSGVYTYSETGYANPHAATAIDGVTLTYDNNGNLTTHGTSTYQWDYKNRLAASNDGIATTTYGYDHNNDRVFKTTGATTTVYANQYYETDGTTPTKYIYAGDDLIATIEGTGTTTVNYIHIDHLGSTNVVTDEAGAVVQTLEYYPYGSLRIDDTTSPDISKKFTGHDFDRESDLTYAGARYQSGETGRFLSQDPANLQNPAKFIHDPQQLNMYSYVRNNPLAFTDPTGEELSVQVGYMGAFGPLIGGAGLAFDLSSEGGVAPFYTGGEGVGLNIAPIKLISESIPQDGEIIVSTGGEINTFAGMGVYFEEAFNPDNYLDPYTGGGNDVYSVNAGLGAEFSHTYTKYPLFTSYRNIGKVYQQVTRSLRSALVSRIHQLQSQIDSSNRSSSKNDKSEDENDDN